MLLSIFKQTCAICALILIIAATSGLAADEPTLTIDNIEGTSGIIKIHYTSDNKSDEKLVTMGWQYSINDGKTWLDIDEITIGNNEPKPPGSSYITWDTERGANNLADALQLHVSVRLRVKVQGSDTWRSVASMPTARHSLAAVEVNGKIYAIGGCSRSDQALNTVEEYNPTTDTWRSVASTPTARHSLAAAEVNGKIYAIGGCSASSHALNTVEEYNPTTDTWRRVADMSTAREGLAAASAKRKIYAIGGYNKQGHLNIVEVYTPVINRWREVASMPTSRNHLAAVQANKKIYAIGGYRGNQRILNIVEEYKPTTDTWHRVVDIRIERSNLAATSANGKIYAIGGYRGETAVEEYTVWKSKPAMSSSFDVVRHINAAIASPTQDLHLRGTVRINGTASVKNAQLQTWILDIAKGGNPKAGYVPLKVAQQTANNTQLTTWDTTKQTDGIYTLRLRVTDTQAMRATTTVVVNVDNTSPNPPIVEIKPIGDLGDYAQIEGRLTVSGMTEASIKSAKLLNQNNGSLNDVTSHIKVSETGVITGNIPIGKISNGVSELKLQLVIADKAGNEAQAQSNTVPVDNVMPEVRLTSPVNGAYFNAPPIVISGTASDEQTGIAKVEINMGREWVKVDNIEGKWSYSYTPPIQDILLNFQARAYDRAGNQRETAKITVNYLSAMPTANISSPAEGDEVGGTFNVIGSVDDIDTDYSDFSCFTKTQRKRNLTLSLEQRKITKAGFSTL